MVRLQQPCREVVGDDDAIKPKFAAQQVVEDLLGATAGQAVNLTVGVHDRREAGLADRRLERTGERFAQLPRADVRRRVVHASL